MAPTKKVKSSTEYEEIVLDLQSSGPEVTIDQLYSLEGGISLSKSKLPPSDPGYIHKHIPIGLEEDTWYEEGALLEIFSDKYLPKPGTVADWTAYFIKIEKALTDIGCKHVLFQWDWEYLMAVYQRPMTANELVEYEKQQELAKTRAAKAKAAAERKLQAKRVQELDMYNKLKAKFEGSM